MSEIEKTVSDSYQYPDHRRKNLPSAGRAAEGKVKEAARRKLDYDPHLPPVLRFDPTGREDHLQQNVARLMAEAQTRPLTAEEAQMLSAALLNRQPWLEWAGKREAQANPRDVDPVTLHVHERVSTQAILKVAARQDIARNLFADPELEYREAVQFYQHDVAWANRMILGDSLQVMTSLAQREDLTGKVQMIYMDPPYGIKFASNFQSEIGRRDVKEKDEDLTREPEMVKAYRDTWTLGVHSYLAYLRDRLTLSKSLLSESGSIFVQISDENLHRVRLLMDEVFGPENCVSIIVFTKTGGATSELLSTVNDIVLWFAKNKSTVKYRQLYDDKTSTESDYDYVEDVIGSCRRISSDEKNQFDNISDSLVYGMHSLKSSGFRQFTTVNFAFEGQIYHPGMNANWKTTLDGLKRLTFANRIQRSGEGLRYKRYLADFPVLPVTNMWSGGGASDILYVVQTSTKVIQRCMLMTTDPGDLVLDPTCGSGTTAYVAEQWGRRWITIDASRVALSIARQRLLTAKYDYYALKDEDKGVSGGFVYKTVPHITLKSIAQNQALDPIFAEWEPKLDAALQVCNRELARVTPELRNALKLKLAAKEKAEGKKAITDADRRRLLLPQKGAKEEGEGWQHWEVPFDTDPDYPDGLKTAVETYRKTWRGKMDAVNACIAASAAQEELVDQPRVERNRLRVSGPFTVEGVFPVEDSIDLESPIGGAPDGLETFADATAGNGAAAPVEMSGEIPTEAANASAYLGRMIKLLKTDGVRFPNNKTLAFSDLRPVSHPQIHAEGEWTADGEERKVAVVFGPQAGPITAKMVEECIRPANRRGYDDLIFAGFIFDGAAQAAIQDDPNPNLRIHMAHISPDTTMGDLLKDTKNSQLFTVSGLPQVQLESKSNGEYIVTLEGVDIYNPIDNTVYSAKSDKVAAWFLDADYDGGCFCITQAFFPNPSAWEKLSKALTGVVDAERFAALSGTISLPFRAGEHKRIAVKVIDPRGNEVMCVRRLDENLYA